MSGNIPSTMPVAKPLNNVKNKFLCPAKVHKVKLPIGFVAPLYVEVPEIFDVHPLFHKNFVKKYDLFFEGLCPKRIKVPRDVTLEDVSIVFGQVANRNSYSYVHCENPELIVKVERLFMIVHQKPSVPATRIISLGMARGIVCKEKGKKMNWVAYVEWTNGKQC
jgi:hypothetical protein